MKSILDPSFRYTKSVATDLRKTFARVRRELRIQQQERSTVGVGKVLPFHAPKAALEEHCVRTENLAATGRRLKDS
jgi:hypothetical protein